MSVVAVRKNERTKTIEISADSIVVYWQTNINNNVNEGSSKKNFSKLFSINGMIIGCVGDCEDGALMSIFGETHKPKLPDIESVTKFIVEFHKYKRELSGGGSQVTSEFIIVYQSKIFYCMDLLVMEIPEYTAIGAGMDYALTALHLGHDTKEAVKVACDLCVWVSEPIDTYYMDMVSNEIIVPKEEKE